MRYLMSICIVLFLLSCQSESASEASVENMSDSEAVDTSSTIDENYQPKVSKEDNNLLIIENTKMLEAELNPQVNQITYRVQGATSKEMVIQLMSQSNDIYFNLRVEGGETLVEKERKFMFTVASNDVLVIDIKSDKPITEKAVVSTIISQL